MLSGWPHVNATPKWGGGGGGGGGGEGLFFHDLSINQSGMVTCLGYSNRIRDCP